MKTHMRADFGHNSQQLIVLSGPLLLLSCLFLSAYLATKLWNSLLLHFSNTNFLSTFNSKIKSVLNFCTDLVVLVKTICCFPNNKPWITNYNKDLLNLKREVFRDGDLKRVRVAQHDVRRSIRQARRDNKESLERKLQHNSIKDVWKGHENDYRLQGEEKSNPSETETADEFNNYYSWFDLVSSLPSTCSPLNCRDQLHLTQGRTTSTSAVSVLPRPTQWLYHLSKCDLLPQFI